MKIVQNWINHELVSKMTMCRIIDSSARDIYYATVFTYFPLDKPKTLLQATICSLNYMMIGSNWEYFIDS